MLLVRILAGYRNLFTQNVFMSNDILTLSFELSQMRQVFVLKCKIQWKATKKKKNTFKSAVRQWQRQ